MAIDRIYFKKENFVLTLIYGKLTSSELYEHVLTMNRDYNGIYGIREFADCRFLSDVSELKHQDLMSSAQTEDGSTRVVGGKGAIVAEDDKIFGLASMYAAMAAGIREDSQAFRSLNEAIEFLEIGNFKKKLMPFLTKDAYRERMK